MSGEAPEQRGMSGARRRVVECDWLVPMLRKERESSNVVSQKYFQNVESVQLSVVVSYPVSSASLKCFRIQK
jgi:hypothetical protein